MVFRAKLRSAAAAATLGAAALVACATQTPYGPAASSWGYGYEDTQIEENRYKISFKGNSVTDLDTVETYLLYRAADLTLQSGYDWFEIVERDVDTQRRYSGTHTDPFGMHGFGLRYFHPHYGWISYRGRHDISLREITRYEATAEVRFGLGEKPADNARAYDAADVQRNLSGKIVRPG